MPHAPPPRQPAIRLGLPFVLAIVLPLVVLAVAVVGLDAIARNASPPVPEDPTGRDHFPIRERIDHLLAAHDPRVVVLGNSLSNTDLDPAVLESALSLATGQVQQFARRSSIGTYWAAVLENRIIEGGYRPDLVLIVTDLPSLLSVHPVSEQSYLELVAQLDDEDPTFDRRLGRRWTAFDRIRADRGALRERLVTTVRRRSVQQLTGETQFEAALERVFGPDSIDPRLPRSSLPVVDPFFARTIPVFDPGEVPRPIDSFVPQIANAAREAGITLVVVRPPMSPRLPPGLGDRVEPTTEATLHAMLRSRRAYDLDLRTLPVTDGDFENLAHMNGQGATRFTRVVADLVTTMGAWPTDEPKVVLDWLPAGEARAGRFVRRTPHARYAAPPPPLRDADRPLTSSGPGFGTYAVPGWRFLSDPATRSVTPWATRCSPVQVQLDGIPLPRPHETCAAAQRLGGGRFCHDDESIRFTTPSGRDPGSDHRVHLALDPSRACERAQWLYPQDVLTLSGTAPTRASTLVVQLHDQSPDADTPAPVRVALRQGPRALLQTTLDVDQPPSRPATFSLREPVLPSAGPVELTLTSRSNRFLMVTRAILTP